jgi:hypothetical protein
MPFTLAHAAAALPFRRLHLVWSGLVIGTFAPDLEYFVRFSPNDGYGHTLVGALVLSLPWQSPRSGCSIPSSKSLYLSYFQRSSGVGLTVMPGDFNLAERRDLR